MHGQLAVAETPSDDGFTNKAAAPVRYLSSSDAAWEGLFVQAFHEPIQFEGWVTTPRATFRSCYLPAGLCAWGGGTRMGPGRRPRVDPGI